MISFPTLKTDPQADPLSHYRDSLQRHVILHGDLFKPAPSGRSKRACLACRSGKIKCDGNEQCATCFRRGIECKYREQDEDASMDEPSEPRQRQKSSHNPAINPPTTITIEQGGNSLVNSTELSNGTPSTFQHAFGNSSQVPQTQTNGLSMPAQSTPAPLSLIANSTLLDWVSAIQIRRDPEMGLDDLPSDPNTEAYLEAYFTSFHPCWPLIHRPSFDEDCRSSPIFLSVKMIGAWLLGTSESRNLAVATHNVLMDHITPQLVRQTKNRMGNL
jgi:hypothetical protein